MNFHDTYNYMILFQITMIENATYYISLWPILKMDKLFRSNFLDWHRNLRIVLKHENKLYVLEQRLLEPLADIAFRAN